MAKILKEVFSDKSGVLSSKRVFAAALFPFCIWVSLAAAFSPGSAAPDVVFYTMWGSFTALLGVGIFEKKS